MVTTRTPPPTGRPPKYAFAGRAFGRTNLRPVVIVCTILGAVWSLIWTAGAFQDVSGDKKDPDLKKLVIFDILLGALYAAVAAIELFGLAAAISRKLALARLFSLLSGVVILLVAGSELLRTVAHFVFKDTIIHECVEQTTGRSVRTSIGFWVSVSHTLSQADAEDFCDRAFDRGSFSVIAWFIVATLIAIFFASVTYAFYHQLLDPMTYRSRAPSEQVRLQNLNNPNQGAYGYPYDMPQGYGGGQMPYPAFAPPPGPPPGLSNAPPYEGSKLPGYGADEGFREVNDDKDDPFREPSKPSADRDDPFKDASRNV